MKKGITRTVCGILCGVLLSGSGIMQAALIANAKPTSIRGNRGYQWHLQPVIDADNILVGDYTDDAGQQPGFHNYVYIKKNGKYGFIDHEGNIVVEPIYDECNANRYGLDQFRAVYDTKRGESVPVSVGADGVDEIKEGYNWGSSGMPPIGTSHLDGYLWSTADNKMYRVLDDWSYLEINNNESHIVQPSTYSLKSYKSRRFETGAPLSDYAGIRDSKLVSSYFGLACPDRLLVDPEYTYAYANPKDSALYSDNMYFAFAKNKDKWTVFDSQGNKVATDLEPFEENYYYRYAWEPVSVMLYGEDGTSFENEFYVPAPFVPTENVIAAKRNGLCGYIDLDGKILVRFGEFEDIRPFHNGLAWVKKNGKWGVIELAEGDENQDQGTNEEEPCEIEYPGGTVEDVLCTEEMFRQDNKFYHKDISTLAVALSMAAYDDGGHGEKTKEDINGITISNGEHKGYYIMDAYDTLGFENKMLFSYSQCPDEYKTGYKAKILHIEKKYDSSRSLDVIYADNTGYKNEKAIKLYQKYLNSSKGLREKIKMNLYDQAYFDEYDDCAFSIATKEFDDTILVAFSIRGTSAPADYVIDSLILPYDFDIYDSRGNTLTTLQFHLGFGTFYEDVRRGLDLYLNKYKDYIKGTGKQVKFLFTGHSLGAACANICGYAANRGAFGDYVTENDIYTYTYATPNVVTNYSENTLNHARNIFNMLNKGDPFTYIPSGYVKFGNCRHFKLEDEHNNVSPIYLGLKPAVDNLFDGHGFSRYVKGVKRSEFSESVENWITHYYECPVDVEVYYKDKLIGRIKDEKIDKDTTVFPMSVDDSGRKTFVLPKDEEFEVRVTAYDKGSMNVKFQETASNGETAGDMYEFNDIPLEKGKHFSIPAKKDISDQTINVIDDNGKVLSTIGGDVDESDAKNTAKTVLIVLIAGIALLSSFVIVLLVIKKRRKKSKK